MSTASLDASYAACRRLVRHAHSNFTASFLLLGAEKRRAMDALYAFMRHTDDLGDGPWPLAQRRDALAAWRAALSAALDGAPLPCPVDDEARQLLPALRDAVQRFGIPASCLHDAIDGQEMDLDGRVYASFDELAVYCGKVASTVGVACVSIWGYRTPAALPAARQCGIALQLTNILRDLRADLALGRVYLPQADMQACGYSSEALRQGQIDAGFRRLIDLEADRAEACYLDSLALLDELTPDGRRPFCLMIATYHALLQKIRVRADDLLSRPVRLSAWDKLRIAGRSLLGSRSQRPW